MALLFQIAQKVSLGFHAFWDRWPRKEAKKDANKAWDKLKPSPELEAEIHAALDWQVPMLEQRDTEFIPLAATWIRGERWTDQPRTSKPIPKAKPVELPVWQRSRIDSYTEQHTKTSEAQRLMREEGLSRSEAMTRAFDKDKP